MIPKVIYYCWFGNNQKSKEIEMCMESWRKVCPEQGWKIVEINETNFDINFCNFTREAYAQKSGLLYQMWPGCGQFILMVDITSIQT